MIDCHVFICALVLLFTVKSPCFRWGFCYGRSPQPGALSLLLAKALFGSMVLIPPIAQTSPTAQRHCPVAPPPRPKPNSPRAHNSIQAKCGSAVCCLMAKRPKKSPPNKRGFGEVQDRSLNWHSPSAITILTMKRIFDDKPPQPLAAWRVYDGRTKKWGWGQRFTVKHGQLVRVCYCTTTA